MPDGDKWDKYAVPASTDKWDKYAQPTQAAPTPPAQQQPMGGMDIPSNMSIQPQPSRLSQLWEAAKQGPAQLGAALGGMTPGAQTLQQAQVPGTGVTVGEAGQRAQDFGNKVMALSPLVAGPEAAGMIPNAARAGQKFEQVAAAAGNVPVDVSKAGDVALRAQELASRGSRSPKVINDFVKEVTDPNKAPIDYKAARDYFSNARLSMTDYLRTNPKMWRQVTMFKEALGDAIKDAADEVGMGGLYQSAMDEYRRAMVMKGFGVGAGAVATGKALSQIPVVGDVIKGAVKGAQ